MRWQAAEDFELVAWDDRVTVPVDPGTEVGWLASDGRLMRVVAEASLFELCRCPVALVDEFDDPAGVWAASLGMRPARLVWWPASLLYPEAVGALFTGWSPVAAAQWAEAVDCTRAMLSRIGT